MMMSASRVAARNPSPKYMIGSIMDKRLQPSVLAEKTECHAAGASSSFLAVRCYSGDRAGSEWVPGRPVGEFEIADIRAEPHTDTRTDGNDDDPVRGQHGHAEAADEIGRAVDPREILVDRGSGGQVIDQHHGACAFAAHVPAE